jgi:rSAM/selenodomain-associated transferase 1
MTAARVIVLSKAPRAGRCKTRLCPPLSPDDAARLADAALQDTMAVVERVADEPVLAIDEPRWGPAPSGWRVVRQRGGGLDERLAAAFDDAGAPSVLVGMDTPHLEPADLLGALAALRSVDAVLGPATDGGYWLVGLRHADPRAFLGVAMSTPRTAAAQLERFADLGLKVAMVEPLRDVDTIADARAVAAAAPWTGFAHVLRTLGAVPHGVVA